MENGKMNYKMVLVLKNGMIILFILENIKMEKKMELENIFGMIKVNIKE